MRCPKCKSENVKIEVAYVHGDGKLGIAHEWGRCNDCGESGQHLLEDADCILCGWRDGDHASGCLHDLELIGSGQGA